MAKYYKFYAQNNVKSLMLICIEKRIKDKETTEDNSLGSSIT